MINTRVTMAVVLSMNASFTLGPMLNSAEHEIYFANKY